MAEDRSTELTISLLHFDGPFDLLISLIKRNEWSIDDLPVLEITSQFLAYVKSAKEIDAELGGEFVEVGSWLVLLKSRSMLPPSDAYGLSPREELKRAVLDHATVEAVAEFLRNQRGSGQVRPGSAGAPTGRRQDDVLPRSFNEGPTLQEVLDATRRALEAARTASSFRNTEAQGVTVEDQIRWIGSQLASTPALSAVSTEAWFEAQPSPGARAALFLALLELARKGFLILHQSSDFAPLRVKALRDIPAELHIDQSAYAAEGNL
jgi:segregation and condensation protein A